MPRDTILTITVNSSMVETPHSTFATGEPTSYEGPAIVSGIGDGLGRVVSGTAYFTIQSYSTATTYGAFDFGGFGFSTTSLDVAAAATFSPSRGGPDFGPVTVSHAETGALGPVIAGIGAPLNFLYQQSDAVPIRGLGDRDAKNGFTIDVEATSLATPYVDGVPNPTGVFGGLQSSAAIVYEVKAASYGGGADTVKGGGASDVVALGRGADTFRGGGGSDAAVGEGGADRLWGQRGNDWLSGGAGNDVLYGNGGGDVLLGNGGNDVLRGGGSGDDLIGGSGHDLLLGGGGGDEMIGGSGRDRLLGGGGGDEMIGGGGRDILLGGGGDDVLIGGRGRDTLAGGRGDDTLTGGGGADRFDFRSLGGDDLVTDFRAGVDEILLTRAMANDWRTLAGYTNEDGVGVYDDDARVPYFVSFEGVTSFDDVLDAIVIA